MTAVARFSVSIPQKLLAAFDRFWQAEGLPTRSEGVEMLIRQALVTQEWQARGTVAGAIVIVYDHHQRLLTGKLTEIQHHFEKTIIASQHAHLDHDNCLETVIVRGPASTIQKLTRRLKAVKGLKHLTLAMTTAGQEI